MKRTNFLEHIAWTGAGIAYSFSAAGMLTGRAVAAGVPETIDFVQISDSHIGFHQPANPNVTQTLEQTVAAINALQNQPRFVIHTGDVTHLSKPAQFDEARSVLSQLRAPLIVLPGEHDYSGSNYQSFAQAFPQNGQGGKWHAWDEGGIHFVSLIN
ncbi:MAG TPA: metallophosphoesterase, partial [Candidatus Rubrimentiphilum sp.]|nr:metallophosphoesterase [Candidatus Rubrimentiphilum sp.]